MTETSAGHAQRIRDWCIAEGLHVDGDARSGPITVACAIATALFGPALGWFAGWPLGLIALPSCLMLLERQRAALRRVLRGEEPKHHWRIVS